MTAREWDLLQDVSPQSTSEILALASSRKAPEGEVLFRIGDEAEDLYLVRSGGVSLTFPMRIGSGREDVLAEERRPGQLVGWSGLIPPYRFTLQGIVTMDAELLVLPGQGLRDLFLAKPEIGHPVLSNLARIVGQRLTIFQTMWIRELQRVVEKQGG